MLSNWLISFPKKLFFDQKKGGSKSLLPLFDKWSKKVFRLLYPNAKRISFFEIIRPIVVYVLYRYQSVSIAFPLRFMVW